MSTRSPLQGRLAAAVVLVALSGGILGLNSAFLRIRGRTDRLLRLRAARSEVEAWASEIETALSRWEARALEDPVAADSTRPSCVTHRVVLDGRGERSFPPTVEALAVEAPPWVGEVFAAGRRLSAEGRWLEALAQYERILTSCPPAARWRGAPVYAIGWVRVVEVLQRIDNRPGFFSAIVLGAGQIQGNERAFRAGEVCFLALRLRWALDRHHKLASQSAVLWATENLRNLADQAAESVERCAARARALAVEEAWFEMVVPSLRCARPGRGGIAFPAYVADRPMVCLARPSAGGTVACAVDAGRLCASLLPRLHGVAVERMGFSGVSLLIEEGRPGGLSTDVVLTSGVPGLLIRLDAFGAHGTPFPARDRLELATLPAVHLWLQLAEAAYQELGIGNGALARERYDGIAGVAPEGSEARRMAEAGKARLDD